MSQSSPHVVLLDDSPLYREVYGNVFASEGFRVTPFPDCSLPPEEVLGLRPDLIVVDLRCGNGMRGLDFVRRLRRDAVGWDVPVLTTTPASTIDMDRFRKELRALDVPVFDGFDFIGDLLDAAKAALRKARETRERSNAAVNRLRAQSRRLDET